MAMPWTRAAPPGAVVKDPTPQDFFAATSNLDADAEAARAWRHVTRLSATLRVALTSPLLRQPPSGA